MIAFPAACYLLVIRIPMSRFYTILTLALTQILLCAFITSSNAQQDSSEKPIFQSLNVDITLTVFIDALEVADLDKKLDAANNVTLFIPNNLAFIQTLKDLGFNGTLRMNDRVKILEEYKRLAEEQVINMKDIIEYHIVYKTLRPETIALGNPIQTSLAGFNFSYNSKDMEFIDGESKLKNAQYSNNVNINVTNGVYHQIDRLLIPREIDLGKAKAVLTGADLNDTESNSANNADIPAKKTNDNSNGENPCFPASAFVHTADGRTIAMNHLRAGHTVRVSRENKFSQVFLFSHKEHNGLYDFVQLTTASGHQITLSPSHYMYVNRKLTAARAVRVGDVLHTIAGDSPVRVIQSVRERGLFAPHTVHSGDIVVNGVVVSSYTTAVHPRIAQLLLAPIRGIVRMGLSKEPLGSAFYNGADKLANWLPSGSDSY